MKKKKHYLSLNSTLYELICNVTVSFVYYIIKTHLSNTFCSIKINIIIVIYAISGCTRILLSLYVLLNYNICVQLLHARCTLNCYEYIIIWLVITDYQYLFTRKAKYVLNKICVVLWTLKNKYRFSTTLHSYALSSK